MTRGDSEAGSLFPGLSAPNGKAGMRNETWLLSAVGCVNKQCEHQEIGRKTDV